jgi:signal transduction histidine kinase
VAHEIRNPLNVIKTSVYYLLNSRNPGADKQREHLDRIERQVGLADKVISGRRNSAAKAAAFGRNSSASDGCLWNASRRS